MQRCASEVMRREDGGREIAELGNGEEVASAYIWAPTRRSPLWLSLARAFL